MKIIIVGQYYWPDNFLVNEIAEELVVRGHKVTMLTGLPDYAANRIPKEYKWFRKRHELRNGVEIIRVPIIARHKGFVFRVLNYLSFFITSSLYAKFHKMEADVIMAYQTAPVLMGNAAIVLKKKLKKPLFFYCLDIWPDQMKIWGVYDNNPLYKIMLKYSRYAYGSGDKVGITSKPFRRYLIEVNNVDNEKIVYLPQHASRMSINFETPPLESTITNFIFAGNIGEQQNVECILKAVAKMKTTKKHKVHIYGNGSCLESCIELATTLKLTDRVIFYGHVTKTYLSNVYSYMDAFVLTLCGEKKIGYAANTVPAKFQGYLSAGKPIIAAIDGGAKEIIEESGCGIAVSADDIDGLASAMDEYIENKEKYVNCGDRAIQYFNAHYEKKIVIDQLENYLVNLCRG